LFPWRNDEKPGSHLAWHAWLCSGDISEVGFELFEAEVGLHAP